jgi:hypothetical protein
MTQEETVEGENSQDQPDLRPGGWEASPTQTGGELVTLQGAHKAADPPGAPRPLYLAEKSQVLRPHPRKKETT